MDNTITIVGNVTRDFGLHFTAAGQALADTSIAVNRKWKNRATGEQEEEVSYIDITLFGQIAENASESLEKGTRVIVTGRFKQDRWEDKETGKNRSKHLIIVDAIGPELRFATAEVTKNPQAPRTNGQDAAADSGAYDEAPF